ncbi:MAG: hypothetical protein R2795_25870 [Saprospiraceae bacterium]
MKIGFFPLLAILAFSLSLNSCLKDDCSREVTYLTSVPVFKNKNDIRQGTLVAEAPRNIQNPGQFYYYDQHILIAEQDQGIHIIDNHNPEAPQPVAFLAIEGADNMAIKNNILYVNNYIDLLTIDISDVRNATLLSRTEDMFPPLWEDLNTGQILVEYKIEEITQTMDCQQAATLRPWGNVLVDFATFDVLSSGAAEVGNVGGNAAAGTGIGGSLARFTIVGDYLYSVDQTSLDVISIAQPVQPVQVNTVNLGWGIETIFPYEDKLFIGSNSGMFIFDNSNPAAPSQLSAFAHARACDPVFVKGNYAYVTLRDGTACEGFVNQLDLVDITNITAPVLEKSFPMDNPHGLTIRGNDLVLCEGAHGLKAFDITEPTVLDTKLLDTYTNMHAVDAISLPGSDPITVVIGQDGFYQFRFTPENGFQLLSKIGVAK